jgi:hypothetical protein
MEIQQEQKQQEQKQQEQKQQEQKQQQIEPQQKQQQIEPQQQIQEQQIEQQQIQQEQKQQIQQEQKQIQQSSSEIPSEESSSSEPESEIQKPEPEIQKPESEIQKPESEIQKPEPEIQKPEPEIQNQEAMLHALNIREKQIRSKIINRKRQCEKEKEKEKDKSSIFTEKVSLKTVITENEEKIANILKENKQLHPFLIYQPLIEISPLSIGTINITACEEEEMNEINTEKETNLVSLKYKKITETLQDFLLKRKSDIKQKNKFLSILITSNLQILDAISKMQVITQPIIHFNINEETILYDNINAIPVISDFRMAFTKSDMDDNEIFMNLIPEYEDYSPWPIEIYILSNILNENPNENINEIIKKYISTEFFQKQNPEKVKEFENILNKYVETTQISNKPKNEIIEILKQNVFSWDVYSICILFVTLLQELEIETSIYGFMKQYVDVLNKVIFSEPSNRPQIKEIVDEIERIFTRSINKEEYKLFLTSLQEKKENKFQRLSDGEREDDDEDEEI